MYPSSYQDNPLYPTDADFKVIRKDDRTGLGVLSLKQFRQGELVAAMNGEIIPYITQHSLQIKPGVHLHDIHFAGYFLHSCSPNIKLDMENLLVYAIKPIQSGDYLYMDYAQTEDVLYKQFECSCASSNCRGWITGSKEQVNDNHPDYLKFIATRAYAV